MRVIQFLMERNNISQIILKIWIFIYFMELPAILGGVAYSPHYRPYYRHLPYADGIDLRDESKRYVIRSTNNFGFVFLRELESSRNVFISPISMSVLLGMLYNGARNISAAEIRGATRFPMIIREGFELMLHLVKPTKSLHENKASYDFDIASLMLVDTAFDVLETYKYDSRTYFEAVVRDVSFSDSPVETFNDTNNWVAWRTNDNILNALEEPLEPTTRMFLMNVAYFKGTWKKTFDYGNTSPGPFYNEGYLPKTVLMMKQTAILRYGFDSRLQVHTLEIPYGGEEIDMVIVLPQKRDGIYELEPTLLSYRFNELLFRLRNTVVELTMPKFRLTDDYDLVNVLQRMGIRNIFDPESAELGGISRHPGLHVTKANHMTFIDVNEEGSEAAAVTMLRLAGRSEVDKLEFCVNHPFMFFIRHKKLSLNLFLGRVMKL